MSSLLIFTQIHIFTNKIKNLESNWKRLFYLLNIKNKCYILDILYIFTYPVLFVVLSQTSHRCIKMHSLLFTYRLSNSISRFSKHPSFEAIRLLSLYWIHRYISYKFKPIRIDRYLYKFEAIQSVSNPITTCSPITYPVVRHGEHVATSVDDDFPVAWFLFNADREIDAARWMSRVRRTQTDPSRSFPTCRRRRSLPPPVINTQGISSILAFPSFYLALLIPLSRQSIDKRTFSLSFHADLWIFSQVRVKLQNLMNGGNRWRWSIEDDGWRKDCNRVELAEKKLYFRY